MSPVITIIVERHDYEAGSTTFRKVVSLGSLATLPRIGDELAIDSGATLKVERVVLDLDGGATVRARISRLIDTDREALYAQGFGDL